MSFPFYLHSATVSDSHIPWRAPAVFRPCRSESDFSKPRHSTSGARHGMCELKCAVETACERPAWLLLLQATTRTFTKFVKQKAAAFWDVFNCSDDDGDGRYTEYVLTLKLKSVFLLLLCYVYIMYSSFSARHSSGVLIIHKKENRKDAGSVQTKLNCE